MPVHVLRAAAASKLEACRFQYKIRIKVFDCSATCINIDDLMEARVGIEPTYKGFADLSLTTWVPRP
jgi:hypothetical protein